MGKRLLDWPNIDWWGVTQTYTQLATSFCNQSNQNVWPNPAPFSVTACHHDKNIWGGNIANQVTQSMGHRIQHNAGTSASIVHWRKRGGKKGRKFRNRSTICTSSLVEKQKAHILHPAKAQKNVDFFFLLLCKSICNKNFKKSSIHHCWSCTELLALT